MKKVWVIIKREYLVRVRTRSFAIGTIISPVLLLALIILPAFLAERGGGGQRRVTVLDQSNDPLLFGAIIRRVESNDTDFSEPGFASGTRFLLSRQPLSPDESAEEWIKRDIAQTEKDGSDRAYLILGPSALDSAATEYHAQEPQRFFDPRSRRVSKRGNFRAQASKSGL